MNKVKLISLLLGLISACHNVRAVPSDMKSILDLGLPVVYVVTENSEEPSCEYVSAPPGSMGNSITNATKVPCRILILNKSNVIYDSGRYSKNVGGGGRIKIVGNTSAYRENKPYKIKLEVKADLLDRRDDRYCDKEWRLIAAENIRALVGLKVNELVGMKWTPSFSFVNLIINNDYKGVYYLIESIKRNINCRLNVDDTGYIIERDAYWWKENAWFDSNWYRSLPSYRWTWKYPAEEDVNKEIEKYIQDYINETESSIPRGDYDDYIDVDSFASWLIAHDYLGTYDSGGSNLYMIKYDNSDSKLEMGNLWDFDSIFWEEQSFSRFHDSPNTYFPALFGSSNKSFANAYKRKWKELREKLPCDLYNFLKNFEQSFQGEALQKSWLYHEMRWNVKLLTVAKEVSGAINWLERHTSFMDQAILDEEIVDCMLDLDATQIVKRDVIFNLNGQRIVDIKPGHVYIKKGEKKIKHK